jgi:hypothetical protein
VLAAEGLVVAMAVTHHRLRYLLLRPGVGDSHYAADKRGREVAEEEEEEEQQVRE